MVNNKWLWTHRRQTSKHIKQTRIIIKPTFKKKEEVRPFEINCIFYVLLQIFFLYLEKFRQPILITLFYLKAGVSHVVPLNFIKIWPVIFELLTFLIEFDYIDDILILFCWSPCSFLLFDDDESLHNSLSFCRCSWTKSGDCSFCLPVTILSK